jgi:hypothetical protein
MEEDAAKLEFDKFCVCACTVRVRVRVCMCARACGWMCVCACVCVCVYSICIRAYITCGICKIVYSTINRQLYMYIRAQVHEDESAINSMQQNSLMPKR